MTFEQALAALDQRQETRIVLGLDRIRRHLASLGDPQESYQSFHVAGTNGKGSVCALIAAVLQAAGIKTGLYTSPHLVTIRERISVNGHWISPSDFARLMEKTLRHDARHELTYFELATSVAFQYFREKRVQVAVLETGLGGRFDATNVVRKPLSSIITSIDFDHMKFLGNTLAEIAREKAGIIKEGCPVVCGETKREPLAVIKSVAEKNRAELAVVSPEAMALTAKTDWHRSENVLRGGPLNGRSLRMRLIGSPQIQNAAIVLAAMKEAHETSGLEIPAAAVRKGFLNARWPGRFEIVRLEKRRLILDGAHNPAAMRSFIATLESSPWARMPKTFIVGMLADKEHRKMIRLLAPYFGRHVIIVEPNSPRALSASALAEEAARRAPKAVVTAVADLSEAIRIWKHGLHEPDVAFLCGSFYLVGEALKLLNKEQGNEE